MAQAVAQQRKADVARLRYALREKLERLWDVLNKNLRDVAGPYRRHVVDSVFDLRRGVVGWGRRRVVLRMETFAQKDGGIKVAALLVSKFDEPYIPKWAYKEIEDAVDDFMSNVCEYLDCEYDLSGWKDRYNVEGKRNGKELEIIVYFPEAEQLVRMGVFPPIQGNPYIKDYYIYPYSP